MNDKELLKLVIDKDEVFVKVEHMPSAVTWRLSLDPNTLQIHTSFWGGLWIDGEIYRGDTWTLVPDPSKPQPKSGHELLTWLRDNPGETATNPRGDTLCLIGGMFHVRRWDRNGFFSCSDTLAPARDYYPDRGTW